MAASKEYQVAGMTCGHCEASVREEIGEIEGVADVAADHATGRVVVALNDGVDPVVQGEEFDAAVRAAVEEAGYELG